MVEIVDVNIKGKDHHYSIEIAPGILERIALDLSNPEELKRMGIKPGSRLALITDSNVRPLYGDSLEKSLQEQSLDVHTYTIEPGEQSKSRATRARVEDQMFEDGLGRDTFVLALGGGVVGDLAGDVAAEFLRGVPYIQIPTTLLAQVDSSVGGKTGINVPYGKNLIGAFKQPVRDYIDPKTILTLSNIDLRSGLAEVIKYGVTQDAELFRYLQENIDKLLAKDLDALTCIVRKSCEIKANVVMQDPEETKGIRMILNYGHTVGHAIEHIMNELYKKRGSDEIYPHGYAVAIGMMVAGRIAIAVNTGFTYIDLNKTREIACKTGLPIIISEEISNEEAMKVASRDKKATKDGIRFCLPAGIGKMYKSDGEYATYVDNDIIVQALDQTR